MNEGQISKAAVYKQSNNSGYCIEVYWSKL